MIANMSYRRLSIADSEAMATDVKRLTAGCFFNFISF